MRNSYLIIFFSLFCFQFSYSQLSPSIEWEKCYGGNGNDQAYCCKQTKDKGFIIAGMTSSDSGDITDYKGNSDWWLVKLDSSGNLIWQKTFGGSSYDYAYSVEQTFDGGYILAGRTSSNDFDVSGYHGAIDAWILKLDSTGNLMWQKCLGGSLSEYANSIKQVADSGYIIAGSTSSDDGDVSGWHIGYNDYGNALDDYWIVRLSDSGDILWQKCLGGSSEEYATSIDQTADGNFIIAGESSSTDDDVTGNHGSGDYWIVQLDSTGSYIQWEKCYGGTGNDHPTAIQKLVQGGFIVGGYSESNNGDAHANQGFYDYWLLKLNAAGDTIWSKCYGGSEPEYLYSVEETKDSGFIVAGVSMSGDGDVSAHFGYSDYWIVKTDSNGNLEWEKPLGGIDTDEAHAALETIDGGFVTVGFSRTTDCNYGGDDYWIVKLENDFSTNASEVMQIEAPIFPNPTSTTITLSLPSNQNAILSIFNLLGEKVKEERVTGKQVTMDVSSLPQGVYLVRTENRMMGKFVKE